MTESGKWSDLSVARRWLIVGLIVLGLAIAGTIIASGSTVRLESAKWISLLTNGLAAVVIGLRTIVWWIERRSKPVPAYLLLSGVLLTLILGALAYDALTLVT